MTKADPSFATRDAGPAAATAGLPFWQESAAGLQVALKVQPGARRPRLGPIVKAPGTPGWPPARLKLAVTAPPVDGRANQAVLEALASWLGIRASRLAFLAGSGARDKLVLIAGGKPDEFSAAFSAAGGAR